jgi:hypothetical protein
MGRLTQVRDPSGYTSGISISRLLLLALKSYDAEYSNKLFITAFIWANILAKCRQYTVNPPTIQ